MLRHYSPRLDEGHGSTFLETVVFPVYLQTLNLSQDVLQEILHKLYSYIKLSKHQDKS